MSVETRKVKMTLFLLFVLFGGRSAVTLQSGLCALLCGISSNLLVLPSNCEGFGYESASASVPEHLPSSGGRSVADTCMCNGRAMKVGLTFNG